MTLSHWVRNSWGFTYVTYSCSGQGLSFEDNWGRCQAPGKRCRCTQCEECWLLHVQFIDEDKHCQSLAQVSLIAFNADMLDSYYMISYQTFSLRLHVYQNQINYALIFSSFLHSRDLALNHTWNPHQEAVGAFANLTAVSPSKNMLFSFCKAFPSWPLNVALFLPTSHPTL